jgi:hypothetical protein
MKNTALLLLYLAPCLQASSSLFWLRLGSIFLVIMSSGSPSVAALSVPSASKHLNDRKHVLCELCLQGLIFLVENHEVDTVSLEVPKEQIESETAQSVLAGNHNLRYKSFLDSFQKG